MRELLQRGWTPAEIAALPEHELRRAILNVMPERERTPTSGMGMVNRRSATVEIVDKAAMDGGLIHLQLRQLQEPLERRFRRAFDSLERDHLIEPAPGENGDNAFVVLTPEGREAAKNPVNLEAVRTHALLKPEMLHPKLCGKPYKDFADGEPTSAISEAFKIVEIEVREAAKMPSAFGTNLMMEAFDPAKGPLIDQTEAETTRRALARSFAGAMGRFRNPSTHTHRVFPDLHVAIEELLVAIRLLRFLDEPARK